jgi:hydrogenase maturation protein HypF
MRAFERAVGQLRALHRLEPQVIAADAHPGYLTRRWAENHGGAPSGPAVHLVQHHHAHVAALLAEHGRLGEPMLGVAFDGTGYGDDGTIWGGEFLLLGADSARYARVGHLRTVELPGGDAAVRNPCRMALAYLAASEVAWEADLAPVAACDGRELTAVEAQLKSGVATVPCSSVGRLFDAVAALLGVRQRVAYEAQAAIEVEILAGTQVSIPETPGSVRDAPPWSFALGEDGVLDYGPVIRGMVDGIRSGVAREVLAFWFHVSLAQAVAMSAQRALRGTDVSVVGLTGGVFQNALLLLECQRQLQRLGLEVLTHRAVPPNDGGLALGQAVVAALA